MLPLQKENLSFPKRRPKCKKPPFEIDPAAGPWTLCMSSLDESSLPLERPTAREERSYWHQYLIREQNPLNASVDISLTKLWCSLSFRCSADLCCSTHRLIILIWQPLVMSAVSAHSFRWNNPLLRLKGIQWAIAPTKVSDVLSVYTMAPLMFRTSSEEMSR